MSFPVPGQLIKTWLEISCSFCKTYIILIIEESIHRPQTQLWDRRQRCKYDPIAFTMVHTNLIMKLRELNPYLLRSPFTSGTFSGLNKLSSEIIITTP